MSKIPFTLDAWLKDKSQKIETAFGEPAKVVFTEGLGKYPILAVIYDGDTTDSAWFTKDGKSYDGVYGLFIVTPEEEMTEFEKCLGFAMGFSLNDMKENCDETIKHIKDAAKELLAIARKQLIEERYTSDPQKTDLYKLGKAEALKDLPTWEKYPHNAGEEPLVNGILQEDGSYKWRLYLNGYKIEISDLEKLPGFKED